jgi:hypothetical protein
VSTGASVRGVIGGVIGLAVLDAVISRPALAAATGGAWSFAGTALNSFLNPAVGFFNAHAVGKAPVGSGGSAPASAGSAMPTTLFASS